MPNMVSKFRVDCSCANYRSAWDFTSKQQAEQAVAMHQMDCDKPAVIQERWQEGDRLVYRTVGTYCKFTGAEVEALRRMKK